MVIEIIAGLPVAATAFIIGMRRLSHSHLFVMNKGVNFPAEHIRPFRVTRAVYQRQSAISGS